MSLKTALCISLLSLAVLILEVLLYLPIGFPAAFVGGDFRATYFFLPFFSATTATTILAPLHVLVGRFVKRPAKISYLVFIVGVIFVGVAAISIMRIKEIQTAIYVTARAKAALPLPPDPPMDTKGEAASIFQQRSSAKEVKTEDKLVVAARILQMPVPDRYWYYSVREFAKVDYVALVEAGRYNEPESGFSHAIVLIKVPKRLEGLNQVTELFLSEPALQGMFANALSFGKEDQLELLGRYIPIVQATYKGTEGIAGKLSRPDGDLIFLIWSPQGYRLKSSKFTWLFAGLEDP